MKQRTSHPENAESRNRRRWKSRRTFNGSTESRQSRKWVRARTMTCLVSEKEKIRIHVVSNPGDERDAQLKRRRGGWEADREKKGNPRGWERDFLQGRRLALRDPFRISRFAGIAFSTSSRVGYFCNATAKEIRPPPAPPLASPPGNFSDPCLARARANSRAQTSE